MSEENEVEEPVTLSLRRVEEQRQTNMEFIETVMNFSPYGPLVQPFVIEALRSYSQAVVDSGKPEDDGSGVINPQAWFGVAEDVLRQINEKYGRKETEGDPTGDAG